MTDEARVIGKHAGRILELLDDIRADLRTDSISFEIKVQQRNPAAGPERSHSPAAHKEVN